MQNWTNQWKNTRKKKKKMNLKKIEAIGKGKNLKHSWSAFQIDKQQKAKIQKCEVTKCKNWMLITKEYYANLYTSKFF